ncbi:2-acylglycerol O-acyltransferase 1-like [Thrips palmi]|uniref:Acyltransferase n=1 Tax=Thrips palmi TaxID=161013 RepID=A0A6P9ACM6_THRPL|nr:2-acylglycerol O-acyltransferase 1-like [Thrips palmi]
MPRIEHMLKDGALNEKSMSRRGHLAERAMVLDMRWAPLGLLPLSRRLQTLTVAMWMFTIFVGPWILYLTTSLLLLHPVLRWPVLLYLAWLCLDRNTGDQGGRRNGRGWSFVRGCVLWNYFRDYFPVRLVKTAELPPDKNYLLCAYPHGVIGLGVVCSFSTDAVGVRKLFPGTTPNLVTLRHGFIVPFLREMLLSQGIISAAESSLRCALSDPRGGRLVLLVVGGAREAQLSEPGHYRIVLRRRKGFVRLALQQGVPLVPVFTFNEHRVLSQVHGSAMTTFKQWFRRVFGFLPVVPVGRGFFSFFVPHRLPLTVVVGAPIPVERVAEPSQEQIQELLEKFEKALVDLFHEHKEKYHPGEYIRLIVEE